MISINKDVLEKRVYKIEQYERNVNQLLLGKTYNWLSLNKNTIDVGAATGIMSSYFCKYSNKVHSFEAVPPVFLQLKKLEDKYNNINCYQAALSHTCGETKFYVDDKRLSNSGIQNLVNGIEIKIPMVTIDSLQFSDVGFIKVDTEGTELDVLIGAYNTFKRDFPTCMVECYYKYNKYNISTTYEYFRNFDYKCVYHVKDLGLQSIENLNHFVDIASDEKLIDIHDGDFLFYKS